MSQADETDGYIDYVMLQHCCNKPIIQFLLKSWNNFI